MGSGGCINYPWNYAFLNWTIECWHPFTTVTRAASVPFNSTLLPKHRAESTPLAFCFSTDKKSGTHHLMLSSELFKIQEKQKNCISIYLELSGASK